MKEQTKLNDKTRPSNTPRGGTAVRVQQTPPLADLVQLARERPERLTAVHLTQLQSILGNRAVNRLVNQHAAGAAHTSQHAPSLVIQPKLQVNAVGDKYEQEADAVAKEVVQKLNAPQTDAAPTHARRRTEGEESIAQRIQRQDVPEEDELQLQRQELEEEPQEMAMLQREAAPEEEELQLQRQELPQEEEIQLHRQELEEEDPTQLAMTQRQPQDFTYGGPVDSQIEAQIKQSRGGGQPMEDSIRQPMEQAFGADFSDVRIHTNAQAHDLNEAIQARAFTTGSNIYFKSTEFSPQSSAGKELLAHELTHILQQTDNAQKKDETTSSSTQISGTNSEDKLQSFAPSERNSENYTLQVGETVLENSSKHYVIQALWEHYKFLKFNIDRYYNLHKEVKRIREDQYIVGFISDTLGGVSIPPLSIWNLPIAQLRQARKTLSRKHVEEAVEYFKITENFYQEARIQFLEYWDGTIKGGERSITTLEITKNVGAASAVAASGGILAGGTAFGMATAGSSFGLFSTAAVETTVAAVYGTVQEGAEQISDGNFVPTKIINRLKDDIPDTLISSLIGGTLGKALFQKCGQYISHMSDDGIKRINAILISQGVEPITRKSLVNKWLSFGLDFFTNLSKNALMEPIRFVISQYANDTPPTMEQFVDNLAKRLVEANLIDLFIVSAEATFPKVR